MRYYNNYMQNLATSPNDTYRELMQATINAQWDNTTQVINVLEQVGIGSDSYREVEVRIDYAIDMGTGFKQDDDFKVFAFKDITHPIAKGLMYKYNNSHWITINTSQVGAIANDITVRRCNNVMRWVDRDNGAIHELPCAIEYVLESPKEQKNKDVKVANGHITVICQGNNLTRNLPKNTRFIFNKEPYKFLAYQKMLNEQTFDDNSANLLYLDMYLDMVEPDDDIENNVANADSYNYKIKVGQSTNEQVVGGNVQLFPTVTLNGQTVDRDIEYSVCDCGCNCSYCTVDSNGLVVITGEVGKQAQVIVSLKDNPQVNQLVTIDIVDSVADNAELVITPTYTKCRVKKSITFNVDLYLNGVKQDNAIDYAASGVPADCYTLTRKGNSFTLSALKVSAKPLILTFSEQSTGKTGELQIVFEPLF